MAMVIISLGLIAAALVLFSGKVYRDLAYDNHRKSLTNVVHLKIYDFIGTLFVNTRDLGMAMQNDSQLRAAHQAQDRNRLTELIESQFRQYFTTTGIIRLHKIYVLGSDLSLLAQSSAGIDDIDDETLCSDFRTQMQNRSRAERLKVSSGLCLHRGRVFYNVILPIGALRALGYLQIVVDPGYAFRRLQESLGLPTRITHPDGTIAFQSQTWPMEAEYGRFLKATYVLVADDFGMGLSVDVMEEVAPFESELNRINRTVAFATTLLVLPAMVFSFVLVRRAIRPLAQLRNAAAQLARGEESQVVESSVLEVDAAVDAFNSMSQKISNLISSLEAENEERRRAEALLTEHGTRLEELVAERTTDLAIARDQALAASRVKSSFLANMSHELRTPLNAILGYSEMLDEDVIACGAEKLRPDIDRIRMSGKHLLQLIDNILDLSKIEAGKMDVNITRANVEELVREVVKATEPIAKKNRNQLEVKIAAFQEAVYIDTSKTRQILFNLLSNACKFTENGTISVSVIRLCDRDGEWIQFRVADTGIGIAHEVINRLFQDFTQADSSSTRYYEGSGLGLAICRRFCDLLKGRIRVSSRAGKGSIFTVEIPSRPPMNMSSHPSPKVD